MKHFILLLWMSAAACQAQDDWSDAIRQQASVGISGPVPTITFAGQNLFAPNFGTSGGAGSSSVAQNGTAVQWDTGNNSSGAYGVMGTNLATCSIVAVVRFDSAYAGAADTNQHAGIGVRFLNAANFSGLAMLSPNAANGFEIYDRVSGTEYEHNYNVSTSFGVNYRICITNNGANTADIYLYNQDTGASLFNTTYTFQAGYQTTGYPFAHVFAGKLSCTNCQVYDGSGNLITTQPLFTLRHNSTPASVVYGGGIIKDGSTVELHSDATAGSIQGCMHFVSPNTWNSGTATGILTPGSGATCGITWRNSAFGAGFLAYFNHDDGSLHIARTLSAIVDDTNKPCPLTLGTSYPWTLTVSGNTHTFTLNTAAQWGTNIVISKTDATYTSGYFGLYGSNSVATHSQIFLQ